MCRNHHHSSFIIHHCHCHCHCHYHWRCFLVGPTYWYYYHYHQHSVNIFLNSWGCCWPHIILLFASRSSLNFWWILLLLLLVVHVCACLPGWYPSGRSLYFIHGLVMVLIYYGMRIVWVCSCLGVLVSMMDFSVTTQ